MSSGRVCSATPPPSLARVLLVGACLLLAACAGLLARREGLDRNELPQELREDYDVFALRCSKCHALSRALQSGISDEEGWTAYVTRMRRQPGSGIGDRDARQILRFLSYYVQQQRQQRQTR